MNYQERILRNQRVVGGEPVFKGTRVTLRTVLASLAEAATTEEILADFPTLSEKTCGQRSRLLRHRRKKTCRWPSHPSSGEDQAR
jgi:uncharacterized protein (DUF433 family)